jgi:DNA-binding GntR family transcriptional regulator
MLNTDSPVPLYFQLYGIIRKKIESKAFLEGEKIPSENELATTFGIGRPTVRQACERLIRDGLLEKRKGSGTYVRSGRKAVSIFSIAGTSAAFSEQGLVVTQRIVDPLSLSEIPSVPDNPFSGEVAYFFSRASLYEDEPVLLELIYLEDNRRLLFHATRIRASESIGFIFKGEIRFEPRCERENPASPCEEATSFQAEGKRGVLGNVCENRSFRIFSGFRRKYG